MKKQRRTMNKVLHTSPNITQNGHSLEKQKTPPESDVYNPKSQRVWLNSRGSNEAPAHGNAEHLRRNPAACPRFRIALEHADLVFGAWGPERADGSMAQQMSCESFNSMKRFFQKRPPDGCRSLGGVYFCRGSIFAGGLFLQGVYFLGVSIFWGCLFFGGVYLLGKPPFGLVLREPNSKTGGFRLQ